MFPMKPTQRGFTSWMKIPGLFANRGNGPFKRNVRALHERLDDSKRRSMITDWDRTLDKRNPWPGFKTELEHESLLNNRIHNVFVVTTIFVLFMYYRYLRYSLAPHNSEDFELIRKQLKVPGSFPPDFETEEEKAQWQD